MARNPHGEYRSTAERLLAFRGELLVGGVSEGTADELVMIAARAEIDECMLTVNHKFGGAAEGVSDAGTCS